MYSVKYLLQMKDLNNAIVDKTALICPEEGQNTKSNQHN